MNISAYLTPEVLLGGAALLGVISLATLILLIVTLRRLGATRRRYEALMHGAEGEDLGQILNDQASRLSDAHERIALLERKAADLREQLRGCTQRIGVVRFNAFPDVGSDLSFVVAALDESDNGFVISSLFAREDSRVYGKPIIAGESTYLLTDEEKQALRQAKQAHPAKGSTK